MISPIKFLTVFALLQTATSAIHLPAAGQKGGALNIQDELNAAENVNFKSASVPYNGVIAPAGLPTKRGFYKQTVDHFGNQQGVNGTWFNQEYYIQDSYYKPGGPVLFWIAGESPNDDGWIKGGKGSIISYLMPRYNALVVTLEHRFYGAGDDASNPGRSVPTADLSPESLKLLSANQAIEDNAQFITDFPLLFPEYKLDHNTKWITIGGSYPGSLSAWMRQQHPELVYAAHASSAPVKLELDFWRYSYAIDQGIKFFGDVRQNNGAKCADGWTRAVHLFDNAIAKVEKDPVALKAFKSQFWLSQVENIGDFASAVTTAQAGSVQYGPNSGKVNGRPWVDWVCGGKDFPAFIDPKSSDAELLKQFTEFWLVIIQNYGITSDSDPQVGEWFNTAPITDWSIENASGALWYYQSCNEFGYGQTAQPLKGESWSAYSQYNNVKYFEWGCKNTGLDPNPSAQQIEETDSYYGGLWNYQSNILPGQYDPWHWLSNYKSVPNPNTQSTVLYANATHCNDLWGPLNVTVPNPRIPVSQAYVDNLFDKIFAVYDKWIHG
ncbi:UNVERIFIED_CONTAM: hypothetical protein HDU68_008669 [Siphonaria sp. JEL0065]|nr:hypothetical protein HDU68_008669 [Siphonaria sp. JEL0065]